MTACMFLTFSSNYRLVLWYLIFPVIVPYRFAISALAEYHN